MKPLLYDKTGTVKLGELTNCIECLVEEERNGLFEVSLIYPTNDTLFNSLEEENIIVCNANDTLLNQKFRIYMTRKLMSNKIEVFARHISFDLAYDYINSIDLENQSCEYALNTIFRNSQFSTHYKGYSDIINAQDYKISKVNCIEAIAGTQGSIIDTFGTGAEILRDNTNIHVLNKRGHDNGVSIEYAKNLTGFELEEDYSELITRIIPFASYTDNETNEEILVEANAVDSDYISNYSHPYISYMDFSEKFEDEEIPTTSKLQELAKKYFLDNECDKPKQNFKIEFVPLGKCVGYEGIEDNISLCDTVTIKDTRFNIDTKAKVIKTVFNVLKNKYESMELGEPRTTLGDIINSSSGGEDGKQGPPGPQGPPGADGSIGDFPNSLPSTPVLSANAYGFASIELNWTYENKVYYNYELYASKTKDFTPNTFDLIHAGQTSSYLFQAKPNETWYFRVCAVNTHGERTPFSDQITVTTVKVDNLENYFTDIAIGNAVVGSLTADYMSAGIIKGNWIDAKNLSVTDGNGKRTLDIDSFGNVNLYPTTFYLKIDNKDVDIANEINYHNNAITSIVANANGLKTEVSKKVGVEEVKSTIEQSPDRVTTAFNKIADEVVEIRPDGLRIWHEGRGFTMLSHEEAYQTDNTAGRKLISLNNGGFRCYRDDVNNSYIGGFRPTKLGVNMEYDAFGMTLAGGYHCWYTSLGHNPDVYLPTQDNLTGFKHYLQTVYNKYVDSKTGKTMNIGTHVLEGGLHLHGLNQYMSGGILRFDDSDWDRIWKHPSGYLSIQCEKRLKLSQFASTGEDWNGIDLNFEFSTISSNLEWDFGGQYLKNGIWAGKVVGTYSVDEALFISNEDYAELKGDVVTIDNSKLLLNLARENKELKIENEILKQQQCEQDEILIENAFAIANIELRGLHNV